MPELRRDPVMGNWVIISPERKLRPQFFGALAEDKLSPENCPFCTGNEAMTPPEIYALRDKNSQPNEAGWQLRVVPNKYPALRVEGELIKQAEGFYDKMNGIGAHEVVIETPLHGAGMDELETEAVARIFLAFKRRVLDLKKDIRLRYIHVFKGHGRITGATVPHPHSQIVALPVIPAQVREQLTQAEAHFKARERCIFCDIIFNEIKERKRLLVENSDYIAAAPYASRLPFELAIYPKSHSVSFEETPDSSINLLAGLFRDIMGRINKMLERPAYSLALYNAPFGIECSDYFHWHLRLVPMFREIGGFEMGTGVYVNPVPPEEAVKILNAPPG